ncbi:hypothetical protein KBI23_17785 [bacterium]|nr:hypothetical protein [bacterium]MBP9806780.1 hypothetical protein [bacterium]
MKTKKLTWAIKAAFTFLISLGILFGAYLYDCSIYEKQNPLKPSGANSGANGLWLRYYWYAGKHNTAKEWDDMLERLRVNQIKYAYFHVLTTVSDGTLKLHKLENAQKITKAVHTGAPNTKAIAWVYIGSAPQNGGVNLMKPETRANLVKEALWLVNECGFDGVQLDYEFCFNGDKGLLSLLDETRAALKPGQLLSVDTPMWYPFILWGWSDDYFKEVAKRCDQICVMGYDSYLYWPRAYAWLVAQQVVHVSTAADAANKNCKVIIGLPSYEDVTLAHHHKTESLANSLRGLNDGLADKGTVRSNIEGIALFADYTTDEAEWKLYSDYWLKRSK